MGLDLKSTIAGSEDTGLLYPSRIKCAVTNTATSFVDWSLEVFLNSGPTRGRLLKPGTRFSVIFDRFSVKPASAIVPP